MGMNLRIVVVALLLLGVLACSATQAPPTPPSPASGVTCEQLFSVAKSALQYRDEGYTLSQVLAALKDAQGAGKLTAQEIETLRKAITMVYMSNASPEEIGIECRDARGTR